MARKITVKLGSETAVAILMDGDAPRCCSTFWNALPMRLPAFHAKICNHEIMAPTPIVGMERENLQVPKAGDIGWWDLRNSINIWYDDPGPSGPLGPTALIGRVTENLKGLRKEGLKLWKKQGTMLCIFKLEE